MRDSERPYLTEAKGRCRRVIRGYRETCSHMSTVQSSTAATNLLIRLHHHPKHRIPASNSLWHQTSGAWLGTKVEDFDGSHAHPKRRILVDLEACTLRYDHFLNFSSIGRNLVRPGGLPPACATNSAPSHSASFLVETLDNSVNRFFTSL